MVLSQRRGSWVGLAGAVLLLMTWGARPALAQSAEGVPPFRGYYAILASMAGASEEQLVQMARIDAARRGEIAKWDQDHESALKSGREAIASARASKDRDAQAAARKALAELQSKRQAITDKHVAAMLAELSPEQQHRWHGAAAYNSVALSLSKAAMSDEQQDKARAIVMAHGEAIAKASDKELVALRRAIRDEVYHKVLTDEQKALVKAPADEKAGD